MRIRLVWEKSYELERWRFCSRSFELVASLGGGIIFLNLGDGLLVSRREKMRSVLSFGSLSAGEGREGQLEDLLFQS